MPGEVKDPTSLHWKCVTCRGLHHRPHTIMDHTGNKSSHFRVLFCEHVVFQIKSNQIKPNQIKSNQTQHGISKNASSPNCSSVCVNLMQSIRASRKSIPPIPTVVFLYKLIQFGKKVQQNKDRTNQRNSKSGGDEISMKVQRC